MNYVVHIRIKPTSRSVVVNSFIGLPPNGDDLQALIRDFSSQYGYSWVTIPGLTPVIGFPPGGVTGQVVARDTNDPYGYVWVNPQAGPKGDKGDDGEPGTPGASGSNGLSAYQVAVANGFVGSESAWLASLKGDDGDPGTPGATGSPGTPGAAGSNGLSAYQVAVANGFVGSESAWLLSLKGDTGATGPEGPAYSGAIFTEDFVRGSAAAGQDFVGNAMSSGSNTSVTPAATMGLGHIGVMRLTSSTTANSGYYYSTSNSYGNQLQPSEQFDAVFCTPAAIHTDTTMRGGTMASPGATAPTNGVYIRVTGKTLDGVSVSAGSSSVTSTSYELADGTWYGVRVTVNAARTSVTFTLYSDAGAVLWTNSLSTNIPTGSSVIMARGFLTFNTGTVVRDLVFLDLIQLRFPMAHRGQFQ